MNTDNKIAIACDLSALTEPERLRRRRLAGGFARAVIGRGELADGFEFHVDPAKVDLPSLAEWIALEHRCSPFLHFRIEVGPADTHTVVALGGGEGVKEFLRGELGA
ncbi:MAG TPA: hypothetical protein VMH37_02925 [Candidatus Binataceae bacterium]|nr:hypothetical protein [Candidatus Binataceae bacterium]